MRRAVTLRLAHNLINLLGFHGHKLFGDGRMDGAGFVKLGFGQARFDL